MRGRSAVAHPEWIPAMHCGVASISVSCPPAAAAIVVADCADARQGCSFDGKKWGEAPAWNSLA